MNDSADKDGAERAAPEGYREHALQMGYADLIGPLYRRIVDQQEWLGLRVEQRHRNRGAMAHGGLVASLADILIGRAAVKAREPRRGCLSVSLSLEYLSPAPLGCWLDGYATIDRAGGSLAVVSCRLFADGEPAAQARGVLKYLRGTGA